MAEENVGLFRKSSIDRISSPEKLNEYIKITNPSLILILVALLSVVTGFLMWVFLGNIPEYSRLNGIIITNPNTKIQKVYAFVPISEAVKLELGMEVQISPEYAPRENYGYIKSKILSISKDVINSNELTEKFENYSILGPLLNNKNTNLIEIDFSVEEWSGVKNQSNVEIIDGAICNILVVVSKKNPSKLIFEKR
ncbi:MAG: hypothetical protein RsTaC01_1106 [Candidatus Paraimprobicoccus trichonymphae]|uniref:Uncharacterized protein n=1 Tax=Candidatus Paraimprobicoccus trichonymphae TaxID=3033793 RepID=A0AA48HXA5_9FIRM|nr:MAG: hypothetical protein RsTaC01_1106 [Candidatus Paraimprobicoccus trichonymphae]